MEIIGGKLLIIIILLIANLNRGQNIQLSFYEQEKLLKIKIRSKYKQKIYSKLEYANERWIQISKLGLHKNQLYLFLYNENNRLLDNSIAYKNIYTEETPDYYKEVIEKDIDYLYPNTSKILEYKLLFYNDIDSIFKDYPCKKFNCMYSYYNLEKGKKYKLQIQLKIRHHIYKSNFVEFIY